MHGGDEELSAESAFLMTMNPSGTGDGHCENMRTTAGRST